MTKIRQLLSLLLITATMGVPHAYAGDVPMLYPIIEGKLWGYINAKGETVIKPRYKRAGFYSEGLALVATGDPAKPQAYIGTGGKVAIDLPLGRRYMEDFREGLASLKDAENGHYGFIDRSGSKVIPFQYLSARYFSEGLASVGVKKGDRYMKGYIDKQGKMVIAPSEGNKKDFHEGRAAAGVRTDKGTLYGYLDTSGKMVIPARYKYAGNFSEGRAFVKTSDKQLQLIDRDGKVIATLPFTKTSLGKDQVFSSGLAPAHYNWLEKGKPWGFIDRDGQIVFAELNLWRIKAGFSEGLALVSPKGIKETRCIDPDGEVVFKLPDIKKVLMPFRQGVTAVQVRGERGITYYDNRGRVIWKQAAK